LKTIGIITRSNMTPEREEKIRKLIQNNPGAIMMMTLMSNMEIRTSELAFELGMKYNVIIPSSNSVAKLQKGGDRALLLANKWEYDAEGYYSYNRLIKTAEKIVKLCDVLVYSGSGALIDAIKEAARREHVHAYDIDD